MPSSRRCKQRLLIAVDQTDLFAGFSRSTVLSRIALFRLANKVSKLNVRMRGVVFASLAGLRGKDTCGSREHNQVVLDTQREPRRFPAFVTSHILNAIMGSETGVARDAIDKRCVAKRGRAFLTTEAQQSLRRTGALPSE